jgi:hypothetical protein
MYLSQRNSTETIKEYQVALARKSDFFPAQFNLAGAYLVLKDNASAQDTLVRARASALNAAARTKIDEMIAQIDTHIATAGVKGSAEEGWRSSRMQISRE